MERLKDYSFKEISRKIGYSPKTITKVAEELKEKQLCQVKGIDIFRQYFRDYTDNYVIIGGTACDELIAERGFRIVVTHHVPSFQLSSSDFAGSRINGAFTVELEGYIMTSPISYWIYGHSHRNINKQIGKTQCLSNQLGYVSHHEHTSFDRGRIIHL